MDDRRIDMHMKNNLSQERQATKGTEMLPCRMITPFNKMTEKMSLYIQGAMLQMLLLL